MLWKLYNGEKLQSNEQLWFGLRSHYYVVITLTNTTFTQCHNLLDWKGLPISVHVCPSHCSIQVRELRNQKTQKLIMHWHQIWLCSYLLTYIQICRMFGVVFLVLYMHSTWSWAQSNHCLRYAMKLFCVYNNYSDIWVRMCT